MLLLLVLIFSAVPVSALPGADTMSEDAERETEQVSGALSTAVTEEISTDNRESNVDATANAEASATVANYTGVNRNAIPDGIYALQNYGNTGLWMDIEKNLTTAGAHVQQCTYTTSPADTGGTYGLFKITQVGTTGRYIIRVMLNTNLTFGFSGTSVLTKTISATDSNVSASDTFYITYSAGGYLIRPYGSSYYVCANDTDASGMSGAPDSYLAKKTLSEGGSQARWILEGYSTVVEDGVYAFRNLGNSGRWMDIRNNSCTVGGYVQQYSFDGSSPADTYSISGLYKVSRIGSTNRYVIRLMLNNLLSPTFSGTDVKTKKISEYDTSVATADTFTITFNNGGYIIKPYNSTYAISAKDTDASGASGAPDSNLQKRTLAAAGDQARWQMERYLGEDRSSCFLSGWSKNPIVVGDTVTVTCYSRSTIIGANTPHLELNSDFATLASGSWNASTKVYTLTAMHPGNVDVNSSIKKGTAGTVVHQGWFSVFIMPEEGTYMIQNAETNRYMDIEGPSTAAGANIQQWNYYNVPQMKWKIVHSTTSKYVRIQSVYSNLYLGIDSSNPSLVKQYATENDYTLWKIQTLSSGNKKLICKATESAGKVLSVPLSYNANGTDLTNIVYTNDSNCKDEWHLYKLGDYTVNISVLYDNAYSNRYSNAYSRINNQILTLQEKYMQEVGIVVNNISLTSFSSYADTYCTTSYTTKCSHTSETCHDSVLYTGGSTTLYSLHHTNIFNIMLRIPFPNLSHTVKVAYIGHELCTETSHTGCPYYGLTYESIGLATIMNFSSEESETKTFIHEFGHFYGIEDHYGGSAKSTDEIRDDTGNAGYSEFCIYGENRECDSVLNNYTICDGCKTTLRNNMSRFNH